MPSKCVLTWMGMMLASLAPMVPANAIPAFARLYRTSCSMCHDPVPRLNAFGRMFVGNGYRFFPGQPVADRLATGDPLLQVPERLRLALRLDAYATAYASSGAAGVITDLQTPYNLKVLSGGPLTDHLSYYIYFMLSERGATGGIEDAYVTWNELAGAPVSVSVGQFQVSDVIFPRELRLEYQDYAIYRARIGNTPTDLTYDRGLMVNADVAGFALAAEMVNGNGNGGALDNRRFDNDRNKSFLGHVSRQVAPGIGLGLLGYVARQDGAAPGGPAARNRIWMLGGDASVGLGPIEVRGQFIHRVDTSPTFTSGEPTVVTDGGFGEVLWHPAGTRWYAIGLYNRIHTSEPLLDVGLGGPAGVSRYETVTGGGGYVLQRNLRVYAEATWDREQRTTQWTLGTTMAF